jgi:uncharacterized membrane protein YraQ (UPF0718 family)
MLYLHIVTLVALAISVMASRQKTLKAARIALKRFLAIFPAFLTMLILVSVVLFLVPDNLISQYLGSDNILTGVLCGAPACPHPLQERGSAQRDLHLYRRFSHM